MVTSRPGDDPTPRAGEGGAYRKTPTQLATDPAFTGTYASLSEVRSRSISPTQDTYGASTSASAATNSTAFTAALAAAKTAGAQMVIPGGTFNHQGITAPVSGGWTMRGCGVGVTTLNNTHATNASITGTGPGGGTYLEAWTLSDLSVIAANVRSTGQSGLKLTLATRFLVENVQILFHDANIDLTSVWRGEFNNVEASSGNYGVRHNAGYAGSTPLTANNVSCANSRTAGVYIEDQVDGLTWTGGDFAGCVDGFQINGNSTRNLLISGVNFETLTGTDIVIGTTGVPNACTIIGCRHLRTGATGTRAIDLVNGGPVTILTPYFSNYTTAIRQQSNAGSLSIFNPSTNAVGTFLNSNGTSIAAGGFIVANPLQYTQISYQNFNSSGGFKSGVVVQSTAGAIDSNYHVTLCNAAGGTYTLPSAVTAGIGKELAVKNINATSITLGSAAGNIDGAATISLTQYQSVIVRSSGSNWFITGKV